MTIHFYCSEVDVALLNENACGATRQAQIFIKRCIKLAYETWKRNGALPRLRNKYPSELPCKVTLGFSKKEFAQLTDLEHAMSGLQRNRIIYACVSTYIRGVMKGI